MPELPEVETIKERLLQVLPGKKISQVKVLREKSFWGDPTKLHAVKITNVSRKAKIIQIHLDTDFSILVHLKMTGQLIYQDDQQRLGGGHPTADWVQELPSNHTRIIINFDDGARLFFNDMRVFGWFKLVSESEASQEFKNTGPDINTATITSEYLQEKFKNKQVAIKQAIMDNKIVAGVGNIYANDALHLAKIDPFRSAKSLSKTEVADLTQAMKEVINLGIELQGATMHDFKHIDGFSGGYQNVVRVYGKEGESCPNCGTKIIRKKQGGRSTFYCPDCQI